MNKVPHNILDMQNIVQIGIVVRDIEESLQNYAKFLKIEKPQWFGRFIH